MKSNKKKTKPKILITGGAGFIGSEFVRQSSGKGYKIIIIDKLTYCGDLEKIKPCKNKYKFYKADICSKNRIDSIIKNEKPYAIVHFAAETHVDRSIKDIMPFIKTNIEGTNNLVTSALKYKVKKFIHISTDEIYGDSIKGRFKESAPINPNNPYSATKAAAEFIVRAAVKTYGLPGIIVRPANNYGPWQYPEKLIPVVIEKAQKNQKVPVYGKGKQIREWLHVSDCCRAIDIILSKGNIGEIYNIGTYFEQSNIETVRTILRILNKPKNLIKFVKDRPGHDFRYSVNYVKLKKLGWKPKISFSKGISETIDWYIKNVSWLNKH